MVRSLAFSPSLARPLPLSSLVHRTFRFAAAPVARDTCTVDVSVDKVALSGVQSRCLSSLRASSEGQEYEITDAIREAEEKSVPFRSAAVCPPTSPELLVPVPNV